jgi:hypothetical protein
LKIIRGDKLHLVDVVSVRVNSVVHEFHPTLLKELDEHVETMGSHRNLMLKNCRMLHITEGETLLQGV